MFNHNPRLNRDSKVAVFNSSVKMCEEIGLLFRLEGFEVRYELDPTKTRLPENGNRLNIAIVDFLFGDEGGIVLLRELRTAYPGIIVIMTGSSPRLDDAVSAMKLGAIDVFSIPVDKERLLLAAREALRTNVQLGAFDGTRREVRIRGFSQLTPREREVAQLIANGRTNKEAGRDLKISSRTIELHRSKVMLKLGARNAADLLRIIMSS